MKTDSLNSKSDGHKLYNYQMASIRSSSVPHVQNLSVNDYPQIMERNTVKGDCACNSVGFDNMYVNNPLNKYGNQRLLSSNNNILDTNSNQTTIDNRKSIH